MNTLILALMGWVSMSLGVIAPETAPVSVEMTQYERAAHWCANVVIDNPDCLKEAPPKAIHIGSVIGIDPAWSPSNPADVSELVREIAYYVIDTKNVVPDRCFGKTAVFAYGVQASWVRATMQDFGEVTGITDPYIYKLSTMKCQ